MEIGIPSADPTNTMFAHEDSSVGIVKQVSRQMRKLGKSLFRQLRVP